MKTNASEQYNIILYQMYVYYDIVITLVTINETDCNDYFLTVGIGQFIHKSSPTYMGCK